MVAQEANRCQVLAAVQVPTEGSVGRFSGVWHKDCRVFFAADMAVLLTAGAAPFCIPLGLHPSTILDLFTKAMGVQK